MGNNIVEGAVPHANTIELYLYIHNARNGVDYV